MRLTREDLAMLERRKSRPGVTTARRKATPKERDILRAVIAFLQTVPGVVVWRQNSGMAMLPGRDGRPQPVRFGGIKGCADIIGWYQKLIQVNDGVQWGRATINGGDAHVALFFACEIKRPGRYPTPEQQAFLDAVKAAGGVAIVARSVDDVRKALGL